jgi:hypothetical protein
MERNVVLLEKTLEHIKAFPEDWDQGYYRCGTAMCFAGHASMLAGAQWAVDDGEPLSAMLVTPSGQYMDVHNFAKRELGLTEPEAGWLFDGNNDIAELEEIVDSLKNGGPYTDAGIWERRMHLRMERHCRESVRESEEVTV